MDEDPVDMEPREFLKQAGVTSRRGIDQVARGMAGPGKVLRPRRALASPDAPGLDHDAEAAIPLG